MLYFSIISWYGLMSYEPSPRSQGWLPTGDPTALSFPPHGGCHDGAGPQGLGQDQGLPRLHPALAQQTALPGYARYAEPYTRSQTQPRLTKQHATC